jgi:two-component system sensor histidine kinase KdpD
MARGTLRLYLGAAPGVGKTYAMLNEGWRRAQRGTDVVVGFVETHGRDNTAAQIRDLEVVPRTQLTYRDGVFEEMDVDAILARAPTVALVDELAHTNIPGSRHEKRWEDVDELLAAGIHVISTLNIQHLESLNDVVSQITGVTQQETIPDAVVRRCSQIELVDMTPEALRRRMAHGNVYAADKLDAALSRYFRLGNLTALRELALLWVADRVDEGLHDYRDRHGITAPWETKERVVVALTGAPGGDRLLRRGARMAARTHGELIGLHVRSANGIARHTPVALDEQRALLSALGGRYAEVTAANIAGGMVDFARAENATQLLLGASRRSRLARLTSGSVINDVIQAAGPVDVHVISDDDVEIEHGLPRSPPSHRLAVLPPRRRQAGWVLALAGVPALALALIPLRDTISLPGALLCLLLATVAVATVGGALPALTGTVIAFGFADWFFIQPFHTFRVDRASDAIDLLVFVAVAGTVSTLVDRLARRTLQFTRSEAESEALARLAGGAVLTGIEPLPDVLTDIRRTFDLDAVAVLAPTATGWEVITAAGSPVPERPEDAPLTAELAQGMVLAVAGVALGAEDRRLLNAFIAQLRLAQERTALQAEAQSAGALAEANQLRSALLAAVSHDLRTPLAAIKAAATSLLSGEVAWTEDDSRGFAKTIDAEADRLTHLVSNLLDMSRIQAGVLGVSLRPVLVDDLLYTAVASLGAAASGIVIDVAEVLPPIAADPGLLERALANVMDNALAWSPEGTAVRVEAGLGGDHLDIRIIDQGPGIPLDEREHVFRPFQQLGDGAGRRPGGVGLGLAVARGFVEAIGGELILEDTPGGGTTVVFSLPRAAGE